MSPTYISWLNMRQRCLNPNKPKFQAYGAVGISIDPAWDSFEVFLRDMGERPAGMTLDRWPDNAGNYGPMNCRWATPSEQSENLRTTTMVVFRGETMTLSELSRRTGVNKQTLAYRVAVGWDSERLAKQAPIRQG